MDLGLEGKAALVTGANRGIGMAIAKGLAREGCNVAMCSRNGIELGLEIKKVNEVLLAPREGRGGDRSPTEGPQLDVLPMPRPALLLLLLARVCVH